MTVLVADDVAWNRQLRRVDLRDGTVKQGVSRVTHPLAVTDRGVVAGEVINGKTGVALFGRGLTRQWRADVPASDFAVVGDGAFFGVHRTDYGSIRVRAIELADGNVRWDESLATGGTGIAYRNRTVFVTRQDGSAAVVDAIDSRTGDRRTLWRRQLQAGEFLPSMPVVADGTIYVGRINALAGEPPPALFALDAADGTERWTADARSARRPVVTDNAVIANLTAYSPADGTELWSLDRAVRDSLAGGVNYGGAVASSTSLFFATVNARVTSERNQGNSLYALDLATGSVRWRHKFSPSTFVLRVVGDRLVVGTHHGEVLVLR